jgi:hypothetical protein
MLYFRKLLKLPSPKELGWADSNALESREFSDEPHGKTWEDWHEHVKKEYPVKYFFAETLADFLKYKVWFPVKKPFADAWYWLVSHVVPSRRHHMLDLRQTCGKEEVSNYDCYRYGWSDVPEKMLYAIFNLLGEYLNKENVTDLTKWYSQEDINKDSHMKQQQDHMEEARMIYRWWLVGRKQARKEIDDMRTTWHDARRSKDPKKEEYWDQFNKLEEQFENTTDDMIARVMKIRRILWT